MTISNSTSSHSKHSSLYFHRNPLSFTRPLSLTVCRHWLIRGQALKLPTQSNQPTHFPYVHQSCKPILNPCSPSINSQRVKTSAPTPTKPVWPGWHLWPFECDGFLMSSLVCLYTFAALAPLVLKLAVFLRGVWFTLLDKENGTKVSFTRLGLEIKIVLHRLAKLGLHYSNEYINLPPLLKLELESDLGMPRMLALGGMEGNSITPNPRHGLSSGCTEPRSNLLLFENICWKVEFGAFPSLLKDVEFSLARKLSFGKAFIRVVLCGR